MEPHEIAQKFSRQVRAAQHQGLELTAHSQGFLIRAERRDGGYKVWETQDQQWLEGFIAAYAYLTNHWEHYKNEI